MSRVRYIAQLGERGRLVLPAQLRRALGLGAGDNVVLELEGEEVRLVPSRTVAARFRGLLGERFRERSLVDELIAERRGEAERASSP